MPAGSTPKRERQYEHIKASEQSRGASDKTAKRIAGATVNKERARRGESKTARPRSSQANSTGEAGRRSANAGGASRTKEQLYAEAKRRNVKGRSGMSKSQLQNALTGR